MRPSGLLGIGAGAESGASRVEPHEIEVVLLGHAQVKEAALCAHALNSGAIFLCAFVVCDTATETRNLLGKGLRTFLASRLPEHMIPHRAGGTPPPSQRKGRPEEAPAPAAGS